MNDFELLERYAREADQEAFAELVRRHADWLYSAAARRVSDAHLAEDVTQAVFLALAQKAGRLTGTAPLSAWLFRAMQCAAATAMRSEARRRKHEQQAAAMKLETQESVEDRWQQIRPLVDDAAARLSK